MSDKVPRPGTKGGPCRHRCRHDECKALRVIAGIECCLCEEMIGWNNEYEMRNARYVHCECLAVLPSVEQQLAAQKNLTVREMRGAPHVHDCWKCAEARPVDDNAIVSRCDNCGDEAYEYDVPALEEFKRSKDANRTT